MRVLVLNRGSSSLKYAVFDDGAASAFDDAPTLRRLATGTVERLGEGRADDALDRVLARLDEVGGLASIEGVGHRVVHGGSSFTESTRLDASALAALRGLEALDPTHLPAEIALVDAIAERAPALPQVACFDTAFHARMPRVAQLFAIPRAFEARGVRRYGFHGLSYRFLLGELERVAGAAGARGRVVLAHLGSGSSLVAVRGGEAVDTTMSFTPNSGVPMGTRSGDLDPGVLLHLARNEGVSLGDLDHLLNHESGLRGLSGTSGDVRDLLAREASDRAAADALAVFCHAVKKAIGALAATIDGLDTLVFSAGIGERAPAIRARICEGLGHLGVVLDAAKNEANAAIVSSDASACTVRVIATDEESIIARDTARVLREAT